MLTNSKKHVPTKKKTLRFRTRSVAATDVRRRHVHPLTEGKLSSKLTLTDPMLLEIVRSTRPYAFDLYIFFLDRTSPDKSLVAVAGLKPFPSAHQRAYGGTPAGAGGGGAAATPTSGRTPLSPSREADSDRDDSDEFSSEDPDLLFQREGCSTPGTSPRSGAEADPWGAGARAAPRVTASPLREGAAVALGGVGGRSGGGGGGVGDGGGGGGGSKGGYGDGYDIAPVAGGSRARKCSTRRRSSEKFDAVMDTLAAQVSGVVARYYCL